MTPEDFIRQLRQLIIEYDELIVKKREELFELIDLRRSAGRILEADDETPKPLNDGV